MSKERIVVNIHYGKEDFKKLFEDLIKITVEGQELLYKSKNEISNNIDITQSPYTKY